MTFPVGLWPRDRGRHLPPVGRAVAVSRGERGVLEPRCFMTYSQVFRNVELIGLLQVVKG